MTNHTHALVLVSGTLLLGLLIVPPATAETFAVGFEEFTAGDTDPEANGYTFAATTASTFVSTGQAHAGTKSLKYEGTNPNNGASFTTTSDICQPGSASVWVYMAAYPDAADIVYLAWDDNFLLAPGSQNNLELGITSAGTMALQVSSGTADSAALTVPGTFPLATWVDLNFAADCATGTGSIFSATMDTGLSVDATGAMSSSLDVFSILEVGADAGHIIFVDDISWDDGAAPLNSGHRFCANPSQPPNYEYHYVDGWTFEDTGELSGSAPRDTDDGFFSQTATSETAYLGKGFTTGSRAFSTIARVETGAEGASAVFAIAYTTGVGGLPSASTDGTGLEDTGFDGGNFDNSVQVVFLEDGNDWNIKLVQNVAGTLSQIGASVQHGNPNDPTTYNFTVDTREVGGLSSRYASLRDANGAFVLPIQNIDVSFSEDALKDQWFGATADSVLLEQSTLVLDDADQDEAGDPGEDSTCIYDLIGESTVNGGSGILPPSTVPDPIEDPTSECSAFCVDSASVPEGFTVAAFNGFLGVLLVAGVAVGGTVGVYGEKPSTKISGGVVGGFMLLGYLVAMYFGLLPLWPLVLVAVLATGAVVLKMKPGG